MTRKRFLVRTSAVALLAGLVAAPAMAEEAAAAGDAGNLNGEIVVTAQKRKEDVQRVPVAISAFTGDTLVARGITNTQMLQTVSPGMQVNNSGASATYFIRGIGTARTSLGLEPSVALYVDDRYIARASGSIVNVPDIERIEVLKGPQGTLYGRNATGGAIRVITKGVSGENEGYVKAGYGAYNLVTLEGAANVRLSDSFGIRIVGAMVRRDGIAHNINPLGTGPKRMNNLDNSTLALKAEWKLSDAATLRAGVRYSQAYETQASATVDLAGPAGLSTSVNAGAVTGTSPHTVSTALGQPNDGNDFTADVALDIDLGPVDFTSTTVYNKMDYIFSIDSDGTNKRIQDTILPVASTENVSQEFQIKSHSGGRLTWLVGLYGWYEHGVQDVVFDTGGATYSSTGNQVVNTTAGAIFGQATLELLDNLKLTVGARESYEKKEAIVTPSTTTRPLVGATITGNIPYRDQRSWTNFTPKATLEYQAGSTLLYATFAKGFKSGGFNYPATGTVVPPVIRPETVNMYELGAKGRLFDGMLRFDASLYHYDYTDLTVSQANGSTVSVTNAGTAKITGLDLNTDLRLSSALTISSGISVIDGHYGNYIASAKVFNVNASGGIAPGTRNLPGGFNADGYRILRTPKFSGYVTAQYNYDWDGGRIPVSLTYSYKSSFDFDVIAQSSMIPYLRQPGYGVLNGRIGYSPPSRQWNASVWANNITDTVYFRDLAPVSGGVRANYADPATYGVEFRYNF